MKKIILLLLISNMAKAQFFNKNDIAIASLSLVAGASNGVEEAIKFHYNKGFAYVHPNASRLYWDPRESWYNKNNSAFSRAFPMFSDGYHLMRGIARINTTAAIAISITDFKNLTKKQVALRIAKKFVISMVANRAGQYLTYDLIYRQRVF